MHTHTCTERERKRESARELVGNSLHWGSRMEWMYSMWEAYSWFNLNVICLGQQEWADLGEDGHIIMRRYHIVANV